VEFTVVGIPCLGLNGGPMFKHTEAFSFQIATEWRHRKRVRLVQGPLGSLVADHPARADRRASGWRRRGKACVRGDDDDEKDRCRRDRGSATRLTCRRWWCSECYRLVS
jgi:hypothetical protein